MPAENKVPKPADLRSRGYSGGASGNFTMIPNFLLDKWMPVLKPGELRVVLYIARRTYGFQRDEVEIGERLIAEGKAGKDGGTGLHLGTVSEATNSLIQRGLIRIKIGARGRRIYEINEEAEIIDCSEKPNSDRSEIPKTERSERTNTKKRKSSSKKEEKKNDVGGSHTSMDGDAAKPRAAPDSNSFDDETTRRAPLVDAKAEFALRVRERHGQAYNANDTLKAVQRQLDKVGASWEDFILIDTERSLSPEKLGNPGGYYCSLAKELGARYQSDLRRSVGLEQSADQLIAAASATHPVPCGCKFGLIDPSRGEVSDNFCQCAMGRDLQRAVASLAREKEKAALASGQTGGRSPDHPARAAKTP